MRAHRRGLLALAISILATAIWAALAAAIVGPPSISATKVTHITETSARLEGTINPNEREVERYFFEYVDQASFEASGFTEAAKTPSGTLPSGKEGVAVSAQISALTAGATYHFRLFAENKKGKTEGPALTFATYVHPEPFGPCANDAFRGASPSGALPDCRAYEQATPVEKNSGDLTGYSDFSYDNASVSGDRISFEAYAPIPGAEGAQTFTPLYLAGRGSNGWSTQGLLPPQSLADEGRVLSWTPDFSHVFEFARLLGDPNETALLDRNTLTGAVSTIVPHTAGFLEPSVSGSSDDGSVVFFEAEGTPLIAGGAKEKPNLYAWDRATGAYRLAGVFNDEKAPPGGSTAGPQLSLYQGGAAIGSYAHDLHAVSADGSSVYFTALGTSQLYLRKNPTEPQSPLDGEGKCTDPGLACTIHLSSSQRSVKGPDPAGAQPSFFRAASADGSKAFFTSSEMLTEDADTGPEQPPAQIGRAKIGESKAEEVKADLIPKHAVGVAVSPDHEYIYWADPGSGYIGRAKLNGAGLPTKEEPEYLSPGPVEFDIEYKTGFEEKEIISEHISSPSHPRYLAVDGEYIYWTNPVDGLPHHGTIGRAKIGAEGPEKIEPKIVIEASDPQGIAVDSEHIYWANVPRGGEPGLQGLARANLTGKEVDEEYCTVEELGFLSPIPVPRGIAIRGGDVYVGVIENPSNQEAGSTVTKNQLSTCKRNGPNGVFGTVYAGDGRIQGVAVDGSRVYWALKTKGGGKLGRAGLELEEADKEFAKTEGAPDGIASDGERLYWSVNGEGGANPGNDLYRYEAATGKLSDLTPDSNPTDTNGAEVQGVLGASEDGSYVYFAANGVLAEGASPGSCPHGKCNLYLAHGGQIEFIARLDGKSGDSDDWSPQAPRNGVGANKTSRISPDGRTLLFRSFEKLTGYESEATPELYRYRAGDPNPILCVSCNPTGLAPSERPSLGSIRPPQFASNPAMPVLTRNLSADGNRVFFEASEALVAADVNGIEGCPISRFAPACQDVYEWEAKGTGSCKWEAQNGGCLYLVSTGKNTEPSYIADASTSGDDVFFFTREQLVGQDEDSFLDVYDAKVGGGLASQGKPVPPVPCEGEACKGGGSTPPESGSPGTALFSGPGSQKPHRKKAKAKKKKHKQKRHAKKHGRAHR
jgi:hypothetical protein